MIYNRAAYRYAKATLQSCLENKKDLDLVFEDMKSVSKAFEESKAIQNKIEKDNPEKVKEKKVVALAANLRSRALFRTIFNSFPVQLPFSSPCK